MSRNPSTVLAGIQAPSGEVCLDVRNHGGELLGRVSFEKAQELIAAGLVSPIGRNGIKYLVFNGSPSNYSAVVTVRTWRGGSRTTERVRNDAGVIIGAPKTGLQHKPISY